MCLHYFARGTWHGVREAPHGFKRRLTLHCRVTYGYHSMSATTSHSCPRTHRAACPRSAPAEWACACYAAKPWRCSHGVRRRVNRGQRGDAAEWNAAPFQRLNTLPLASIYQGNTDTTSTNETFATYAAVKRSPHGNIARSTMKRTDESRRRRITYWRQVKEFGRVGASSPGAALSLSTTWEPDAACRVRQRLAFHRMRDPLR